MALNAPRLTVAQLFMSSLCPQSQRTETSTVEHHVDTTQPKEPAAVALETQNNVASPNDGNVSEN